MERYTNIEFYNCPDGAVMIQQDDLPIRELQETEHDLIQYILSGIRDRYTPATFEALSEKYSRNQLNRSFFEFNMAKGFVRCNWGEYDALKRDIDPQGNWNIEEVKCPLRGECQYEDRICKPTINRKLTAQENKVMKLIADGRQTNEIVNDLFISPATVARHRENIKNKLNLRGVAEITKYYFQHKD